MVSIITSREVVDGLRQKKNGSNLHCRLQPPGTGVPQLAGILLDGSHHLPQDHIGPAAVSGVDIMSLLMGHIASSQVKKTGDIKATPE